MAGRCMSRWRTGRTGRRYNVVVYLPANVVDKVWGLDACVMRPVRFDESAREQRGVISASAKASQICGVDICEARSNFVGRSMERHYLLERDSHAALIIQIEREVHVGKPLDKRLDHECVRFHHPSVGSGRVRRELDCLVPDPHAAHIKPWILQKMGQPLT